MCAIAPRQRGPGGSNNEPSPKKRPGATNSTVSARRRVLQVRRTAPETTLDRETAVARTLSDVAARFGVPDGDGMRLEVPLLDRHLAALVGTECERVNRILNALMRTCHLRRLPEHRLWVSREYLSDRPAAMRACST